MTSKAKKFSGIHIYNEQRRYRVNLKQLQEISAVIMDRLGVGHFEVCIRFVSPKVMHQINQEFRSKDSSTDVLSFPQYEWRRSLKVQAQQNRRRPVVNPTPLGDIVISIVDADQNVKGVKTKLEREICFLLVHGILHLVGHDHMKPAEKKSMFSQQNKLMRILGRTKNRPPLWTQCVSTIKVKRS